MIALLMVLSGCSGNEAEQDSLRQEVERLQYVETENAELKQEVQQLQSELSQDANQELENNEDSDVAPSNEVNPSNDVNMSESVTQDMLDYLSAQLQSSNYTDWNEVAKCDYATEQHLLEVAKKCACIGNGEDWASSIAESISNNPACTGKVFFIFFPFAKQAILHTIFLLFVPLQLLVASLYLHFHQLQIYILIADSLFLILKF